MRRSGAASGSGTRSGLTLVELLLGLTALGVVGYVLAGARSTRSGTSRLERLSAAAAYAPGGSAPPRQRVWALQARLDGLGYTVNVPHQYGSRPLSAHGYCRVSTRSDAI